MLIKSHFSMKKFLKFGVLALVAILAACSNDEPDESGSGGKPGGGQSQNNSSVTIKADGSTSKGVTFSVIDENTFFLDYIKYKIVDSHLEIIGYDPIEIAEDVKPFATVIYNGTEYKTRIIARDAFLCCNNIKSIAIPTTVTKINAGAFNSCLNLASVTFPEGLTDISGGNPDLYRGAFYCCYALTSVDLPSSLTSVSIPFEGCIKMKSIKCRAAVPPQNYYGGIVPNGECVLYVPAESVEAYRDASGWREFKTILPL